MEGPGDRLRQPARVSLPEGGKNPARFSFLGVNAERKRINDYLCGCIKNTCNRMDTALKKYIAKHRNLFWYAPDDRIDGIGESFLVETILNYGNMKSVKELLLLMGPERVAQIFFEDTAKSQRKQNNYYPEIFHFFQLVFSQYV
jgi:hypothetical protein